MNKAHMGIVQRVVNIVEVIADPFETGDVEGDIRSFESWIARQWRRRAFAEISEDKTDVFLHGITCDAHLGCETLNFGRLLNALPRSIVLPAVIKTANAVVFDPAH